MYVYFFLVTGTVHTTTSEALAALDREALFARLLFIAYVFEIVVAVLAILPIDKALTLRRQVT
jgi:hypothetical protein